MWTDGAARGPCGGRAEQGQESAAHDGEVIEASLELWHLGADDGAHVRAGESACATNRDDLLDLGQREPQPTRPSDEREDADRIAIIDPIAGYRPAWRREDPRGLVEPQRLSTDAGGRCDLTDQQPVLGHVPRLHLAPRVKVKRQRKPAGASGFRVARRASRQRGEHVITATLRRPAGRDPGSPVECLDEWAVGALPVGTARDGLP